MVCSRCIMVVREIFSSAGVPPVSVTLGEVVTDGQPGTDSMREIEQRLVAAGFEILEDRKKKTVEKIKRIVMDEIRKDGDDGRYNFSVILSSALNMEYSALSKLFSESENVTIEKYIIDQKIEMVKELLVYDELSLNEIAFRMGYSSPAHLSAQFKKTTGFSPTAFRKLKDHHRKSIDNV